MERRLRERVGASRDGVVVRRSFDGRLYGQSWETPFIEVPSGPIDGDTIAALVERFHAEYERRFGNRFPNLPVQGVTYRVELIVPADKVEYTPLAVENAVPVARRTVELRYFADGSLPAAEYARESLAVGSRLAGPAIVREALSTILVCPGQAASVGRFGEIVIEPEGGAA
jgi:N-methylhydantoinase A